MAERVRAYLNPICTGRGGREITTYGGGVAIDGVGQMPIGLVLGFIGANIYWYYYLPKWAAEPVQSTNPLKPAIQPDPHHGH